MTFSKMQYFLLFLLAVSNLMGCLHGSVASKASLAVEDNITIILFRHLYPISFLEVLWVHCKSLWNLWHLKNSLLNVLFQFKS